MIIKDVFYEMLMYFTRKNYVLASYAPGQKRKDI